MSRRFLGLIAKVFDRYPNLAWRVRLFLERHPTLNLRLLRLYYSRSIHFSRRIVSPETTIVIEGYPRSANSFCCRAFILAQAEVSQDESLDPDRHAAEAGLKIATHVHSSCQIIEAARLGIPVILLIRPPADAVCSWKAYDIQRKSSLEDKVPDIGSIEPYIRFYIAFHKNLGRVIDEVVLAEFETVVQDFSKVIERVNKKYGRAFLPFDQTESNVGKISETGSHVLPNAQRDEMKKLVRKSLAEFPELLASADEVYQNLIQRP